MEPNKSLDTAPASALVRSLPNVLTVLRLLLALPIGVLILHHDFTNVLWLAFIAGLSDGIDGWIARRFNATSRFGAIVDPLADKALMFTTFMCLSAVQLLPWWLTLLVIGRDLLIVGGVIIYRQMTGRIDMEPSWLSKFNTVVQVGFTLSLLANQVWRLLPQQWFDAGIALVALLAIATGIDYVRTGILKTLAYRSNSDQHGKHPDG